MLAMRGLKGPDVEGANKQDVILTCNYSPWSKYSGGAQKSVHMIALEMVKAGLPVTVVYSKAPWEKVPVPAGLPYSIQWAWFLAFRSGISSPLRFLNGIPFYFKVKSLSSPNSILHGNGDEASLFSYIAQKRAFIYTNRYPKFPGFLTQADWTRPLTWLRIFLREPRFLAMALGMRNANGISVTSQYSVTEVVRCFGMNANRVAQVPNGIDPIFLEMPLDGQEKRGILFYGRLTHAKGADLVVEAYALLSAEMRERHPLCIIGNGPLRSVLDTRIKELNLGSITFMDWKFGAELAKEILKRKVICLPSREESFGNTAVETLALGQTLISSRAGSIPEVVGPWGNLVSGTGLNDSSEPKPSQLALQLETELGRERTLQNRLDQREYILAKYSWAQTVSSFLQLYRTSVSP